ncbi:MAG: hypothetical protein ACW97Z_06580 [Candidatus Hodarchaeales archaeon]|jgi:hypothetical protein
MRKIKNIRQRLVEIRNIVKKGGNMTEDQYITLESLAVHESYGIRRQAASLLVTVSKDYRQQMLAGRLNPIRASSS